MTSVEQVAKYVSRRLIVVRTATANLVLPLHYTVGFLNGLSECHSPKAPQQPKSALHQEQQGLNTALLLKTVEPVHWASPLQAETCTPPGLHATPKRRKSRPTTTCLPLGSHVTGRAVACLNDFQTNTMQHPPG